MSNPIIATVVEAEVVARVRRAMASNSMMLSVIDRPATKPRWMSRVTLGKYDLSLPLSAELKDFASVFESVSGLVWSAAGFSFRVSRFPCHEIHWMRTGAI